MTQQLPLKDATIALQNANNVAAALVAAKAQYPDVDVFEVFTKVRDEVLQSTNALLLGIHFPGVTVESSAPTVTVEPGDVAPAPPVPVVPPAPAAPAGRITFNEKGYPTHLDGITLEEHQARNPHLWWDNRAQNAQNGRKGPAFRLKDDTVKDQKGYTLAFGWNR